MTHRSLWPLLAAIALFTPAFGQWQLEAVLNGANEVPPTPSAATGFGYFTLNRPSNTITYYVSASGIAGPTAAHLHIGAVGVANPNIFIGLTGGPAVYEGTTAALAAGDVTTLLNEGIYVNVHSTAFPLGEIRGQLIPVRRTFFTASLDGAQETPPTGSLATGVGRVRLNEPEGRLIYDLKSTGITATVAHIHTGAPGVSGPPLVTLNGTSGHWCGISQQLTAAEITSLKANGMYFNIHSGAFPNGEIRGQILQQVQPFSVVIDGAQETPPTGSAVTGCGRVDYNPATNTLSYSITCGALPSGFLFAHIHRGVVGQAGAIVFTLAGGPTSFSGTTAALSATNLADLFKGNLYVNIHSNAFSGGEIRGQIRPDPYVFGFGGEGTSGKPRINASGYNATTSNDVTISVTNAVPGAGVAVFIGGNTTFSTLFAAPLPLSVAPVGTLWVDADPTFFIPLVADTTGCAEFTIGIPTDPLLDCFRGYLQCASNDAINPANLVASDALELSIL